jgi:hypothetical protein
MKTLYNLRSRLLMAFAFVGLAFGANSQCDFTIEAFDSFGDGWNGGTLDITLDGVPVPGSPYTLATGSNGTFIFTVNNGQNLQLTWTAGGFNGEVSYNLLDNTGGVIYAQGAGPLNGVNYSGTVACITCPPPTNLNITASDLTSANFGWTDVAGAAEWETSYGSVGFTAGSGTEAFELAQTGSATGLGSYMFYDVYVRAVCTPGDTSNWTGPVTFNTYNQGLYMDWDTQCGPGFNDITTTGTQENLGDDGEVGVALPFAYLYQGTLINDITIGSNGAIVFGTQTANIGFTNQPMAAQADGAYVLWDDLGPEQGPTDGIFYEVTGTAPNQQFIIQWNKPHLGCTSCGSYVVQMIIDEATQDIWYSYNVVDVNNATYDYGNSATIGVAGPNQDIEVSFNDPTYLTNNSCAHFFHTDCPNPTNYAVSYTTTDEAAISWSAGLASETEWTVIYGLEGFDPTTAGTTVTGLTATALIIPGLDDVTTYDVYIYANCTPTESSTGYMGQFTTLPNCADATTFNAFGMAEDSISSSWMWTANPGYNISTFAIEYGTSGFTPGTGTYVWNVDTLSYTDTTVDMTLMGGGIYDIYIQSICGIDSSNWVGPVSVTMPLTNDSTCFAENLMVDGTQYIFDNTGGTIDAGETGIAPPASGCNETDGWCNSTLDGTIWFTFDAPASGDIRINCTDLTMAGQVAVYEVTDCNDFGTYTLVGANDNQIGGAFNDAPNFTICGLTPGNQYYLMYDRQFSWESGPWSIVMSEIDLEAGTDNGLLDVCLGDTVDLYNNITGYDAGGTWSEDIPTANFADPLFVTDGLAAQLFTFEYRVVDGCSYDSVTTTVEIYAPSSAGIDGTITTCMNGPFNLFSGLTGNVDFGGQWYDPANNPTGDQIFAGSIPGLFNYDYVTGNGVCPDDTANVILTVDGACDYLNLQELYFEGMDLYPNPTTNVIYISNSGSYEVFNYELTDLNGKVIAAKEAAINGTETTEVSVETLETGIYLIRVYNDNAEKTFRIVKQ